jgi:hypothetical protein
LYEQLKMISILFFNYNIFKLGRKFKNYTNECKGIL